MSNKELPQSFKWVQLFRVWMKYKLQNQSPNDGHSMFLLHGLQEQPWTCMESFLVPFRSAQGFTVAVS